MSQRLVARDGERLAFRSDGQDWLVSWHPPTLAPFGSPHGAAGICVSRDDCLVLIGLDGERYGFPAGRPEGTETWDETLRREMSEEACVTVLSARLLGFARSECVSGAQRGAVLVRSYWRAEVEVAPWRPEHEIRHRWVAPVAEALAHLSTWLERDGDVALRSISYRALDEAGIR